MEETAGTSKRLSPSNWKENVLPTDRNVIEESEKPDVKVEPIDPDVKVELRDDECDQNEEVSNQPA
jgi:hypothetical protein